METIDLSANEPGAADGTEKADTAGLDLSPALTTPPTAKPYGPFGLCLSVAVILVMAAVYALIAGTIIYGFVSGSAHLTSLSEQIGANLKTGDILASLGLLVSAALISLPYLSASLVLYFALSLSILTAARLRGGSAWRALIAWSPWSPRRAGRTYWIIAGSALIYSFIANALIAKLYPASKDWFTVPHDNLNSALQLFALAAVFAPVAEELLFRGWIYTALRARWGFWIPLLVTSAIFASLHYEDTHIYALAVFPIGMALGAIRETSGSLKASITFHAFFNAVAYGLAALNIG